MELAAGTAVDRFVVEGLVGRGGMASVYRIRHRSLNVAYALKVMHVTHPELADRILSEGALQAELRHPNIVTVFDMIEVGGLPALVMEYVDGPSMSAMLEVHQPTLDQVDELVRGMLKGVRAAHTAGLIHRDLKPANILLAHADDGFLPKITDFGLAKSLDGSAAAVQTRTGVVMGTPAYMAPEQFRNTRAVDARADIYSLGVVMYELCAGRRPYDEEDLFDLLDRVRNGDYPRVTEIVPTIPDRMADAIEGAMAVDPQERIATVDQLYDVWCGHARVDRSRVWNRAVLQQIGQSLSQSQVGEMEVPGARPATGRRSGVQPVVQPVAPVDDTPPVPQSTVGPVAPETPDPGPPPLEVARVPEPAPANATPSTLGFPELGPPLDDDDGPVDDNTRFEVIKRPLDLGAAEPVQSEPLPSDTEGSAPADERPVTEWVPEPDDVVESREGVRSLDPAPAPSADAAPSPAPPIPPPALAQASILVRSVPAGPVGGAESAVRPKVSLTDSTPSLHLPPPPSTPVTPAEVRGGGGLLRTVPWLAALLMVVGLVVVGGFLVVVGGSLLYALAPGGEGAPLPPIEVREGLTSGGTTPGQPGEASDPAVPVPEGVDGEPVQEGVDGDDPAPEGEGEGEGEGEDTEAAPEPEPGGPAPAPARPRPTVAKGRVVLTGDATKIRLISGDKSHGTGWVPAGDYELRATFPGQGEIAQRAKVQVRKGETVTVNCVSGFYSCSIK